MRNRKGSSVVNMKLESFITRKYCFKKAMGPPKLNKNITP